MDALVDENELSQAPSPFAPASVSVGMSEIPTLSGLRPGDIPAELIEQYDELMHRFTKPSWFGVGVTADAGKHRPIHRNSRRDPAPLVRESAMSGKPIKSPDYQHRYSARHLSGIQPLFYVSSARRRLALVSWDFDAIDASVAFAQTAAYAEGILKGLWKTEPWIEVGRSYPRKQGCYGRQLLNCAGVPAPTRNLAERLINRFVKARHPARECAAFKLDALKGTTTWEESNPHFDARYASEIAWGTARTMVDVAPHVGATEPQWMLRHEARRLIRARAKEAGQPLTEDQLADVVESLDSSLQPVTYEQVYEAKKLFYGLENGQHNRVVRIHYDLRLERKIRHFGILVTSPCYGRPHDLGRFAQFLASTPLHWADWITVLPPAQVALLHEHKDAAKAGDTTEAARLGREALRVARAPSSTRPRSITATRPARAPNDSMPAPRLHLTHATIAGSIDLGQQLKRGDQTIADERTGDPFERQSAMTRIHMRLSGGDVEQAAVMTCTWWEGPEGDAGERTPSKHQERLERFTRYAEYYKASFEPAKAAPRAPAFWITRQRAIDDAPAFDRLVPQVWREEERAHNSNIEPLTSQRISAVYGIVLRAVSTLAKGYERYGKSALQDVPNTEIKGMLKKLKMTVNTSTIAAIKNLLRRARLIVRTRCYCAPNRQAGKPGRCAAYVVNTALYCPSWARGHIPAESQLAATGESLRRPPAPPPSPDNPECDSPGSYPLVKSPHQTPDDGAEGTSDDAVCARIGDSGESHSKNGKSVA